jgi:hypothetical protein
MPIEIAKGLGDTERDRQVLAAVRAAGTVAEYDFPAHVRPALWILAHRGDLEAAGDLYSITPQGQTWFDNLNAAAAAASGAPPP